MKKILKICLLFFVLLLVGCELVPGVSPGGHTHAYQQAWSCDGEEHWQACKGCTEYINKGKHTDNNEDSICDVCDYKLSVQTQETKYLSIAEALIEGEKLESGETTKTLYCVEGIVCEVLASWGNLIIKDENNNKLQIYGLFDAEGNKYDTLEVKNKPEIGDKLSVVGPLKNYKGTIEIYNGNIENLVKTQKEECLDHKDNDSNGFCDNCGEVVEVKCTNHTDSDSNGFCDNCGEVVEVKCTNHIDSDSNGFCDNCETNVIKEYVFYGINDLHGRLEDSDSQPGVDELTTFLRNEYKDNTNTYILSSGDMWQGSAESNITKGNIIIDWMNELNFVSMTIGNHEYDWGKEAIIKNADMAEFPFLGINIYETSTDKRVDYCDSSILLDNGEIQIGIIGAIGDCYSSISSDKVADIYFKTGSELTALVKAESETLRKKGADLIIYSLHGAMSDSYDEALSNGYVDVVFEGHSHQSYVEKDSNGIYHIQAGGDNKNGIAQVTVKVNIANEKCQVQSANVVSHNEYKNLEDDPIVDNLFNKYYDQVGTIYDPIGTNSVERSTSFLKELTSKLYLEAGMSKWNKDIVLAGGYLSVRSPGVLKAGKVNYATLMEIFPFDNDLHLCSIKGSDLLNRYINNSSYVISYSEYGNSIKNSIDADATYYIVTDSYNTQFALNKLTFIESYNPNIFVRDLMADYIKKGGLEVSSGNYELTSIPEINAMSSTLATGNTTSEIYYVEGEVSEIIASWGNLYIEDEQGNRLQMYGLYDSQGNKYNTLNESEKPVVGDKVIIYGVIKNYNGTMEIINGVILKLEKK